MRILGLPIPFTGESRKALSSLPYNPGYNYWNPVVQEPFTGAWQRNMEIRNDSAMAFHADFACKTLIARDIAKLRVKLAEKDENDIWSEITNPAYSPVLRRPNDYQTRNQFWEAWMLSKLSRGNTYVLKVRDDRNVVTDLHVLDPTRVQPLVADDGSVFYRLSTDNVAGISGDITVPAREMIHDRFNCLFHPLVGTPPVFASGLASLLGINAQKAAALLFENRSQPGGLLIYPQNVEAVEEQRIKENWEQRFSRANFGRLAVLTGGAKYEKIAMTNVEGQMVEQLKWSAEVVCSVYHVPAYKIGFGPLPTYTTNVQAINVEYYSQALQAHIEEIEELVAHALGMAVSMGIEFDTDNLLRMDSVTLTTTIRDAVGAGVMSPNEGRSKLDLKPAKGGESPYLQQQNFSLAALAKRDAQADPFAPAKPPAPPPSAASLPAAADQQQPTPQKFADMTRMFTIELNSAANLPAPPNEEEQKLFDMAQLFALELNDASRVKYGTQRNSRAS